MAINEGGARRGLRERFRRKAAGFTVNDIRRDAEDFIKGDPHEDILRKAMNMTAEDFYERKMPNDTPEELKREYITPTYVRLREKKED